MEGLKRAHVREGEARYRGRVGGVGKQAVREEQVWWSKDGETHADEGGGEMESRGMGRKGGTLAEKEGRRAGGGGRKAPVIKGRQEEKPGGE